MTDKNYQSWGRYPKVQQQILELERSDGQLPINQVGDKSILPYGNGRSYGDVCLNEGGVLLDCRNLNRIISFNQDTGVIQCEAGVLLSDILKFGVPKGWFLPVSPGTQFVTVGGAIANDVHGKNHHKAGTFGCHVNRFELLRSDNSRLTCSPTENQEYYRASIGGLGLTGLITWAEIQLKSIQNPFIDQEIVRYKTLEDFFELAEESDQDYEYTVAWIDCLAKGEKLGRGLFIRGNHSGKIEGREPRIPKRRFNFPIDPPFALISGPTLKLFNTLYYRKQWSDRIQGAVHYEPFFYPLDSVRNWNRVYGSKGFFQYQCALPTDRMEESTREILTCIAETGVGSFLAVLKLFGSKESPGLLSFPIPGATLALDFPNSGAKTLQLMNELDKITNSVGGRVNPSKDARMLGEDFQKSFSNWSMFEKYRDPNFTSSFWRRVTEPVTQPNMV